MYDLSQEVDGIENALHLMFNALTGLSAGVRPPDETPRTGIQCCIKEPHGRNIIMPKAYSPSPVALHLASEKIVRAYEQGNYSSRIGSDPTKFLFPGGLIAKLENGVLLLSGTSGMTGDEDEMISFVNLTRVLRQSPGNVLRMVYPTERNIPDEVFNPNGYIWQTLSPFCYGY
jgi:hypothetical protein